MVAKEKPKKTVAADDSWEVRIRRAITEVEKRCGNGTIMALDGSGKIPVESISTGSLSLDAALGIGGLPRGRVVEIYGPESSGKTTLALSTIAQAQKKGIIAAFVDAEHALDLGYARKLGVVTEHLLLSQPDYGEQGLEIVDTLIQSGEVKFIVVDSVAALVPKAEIDGEMTDQQMGLHARLMSKALRKITAHCSKFGATVMFINQIRHKIGVTFGSPETTTGGQALKFFSSVRMDIRRTGQIKQGEEVIGSQTRIKVVKNKMAPPFKQAEFAIFFNRGISRSHELLDLALKDGVISQAGAWFYHQEKSLAQGRDNTCTYLEENPDLLNAIEKSLFTDCVSST
ncbi:recombinase RecA [Myxococcota bacterium]|nr:recombinase RecA [Myxococcota bacterium]MBU1537531.1 recombinase RecA [Myxococcota bacterium]